MAAVLRRRRAGARAARWHAGSRSTAANAKPGLLQQVGIDQRIGQQLPLDLTFKDETGRDVRLGEFFGKRPVVLALAYYECPMLCTQVLNGMTGALERLTFDAGKDFDVVVVSINPKEGPRLAAREEGGVPRALRAAADGGGLALPDRHGGVDQDAGRRRSGSATPTTTTIEQYAHGAAIDVADAARASWRGTSRDRVSRRATCGWRWSRRRERHRHGRSTRCCCSAITTTRRPASTACAILDAVRIGGVATVLAFLAFLFVSLRRERAAHRDATCDRNRT